MTDAREIPPFPAAENSPRVKLQQTLYTSRNPTRRWLHTSRYRWISSALKRYAHPAGTALEAGPGSGIYLPLMCDLFSSVVAMDVEQEYLAPLHPLTVVRPNLTLVVDDITGCRYADRSFDLILCSEVLEHIQDSAAALREIHRLLKPGGVLVLSTPQPLSTMEVAAKGAFLPVVRSLVRAIYREPVEELGHINLLSCSEVRRQLNNAGFCLLEQDKGGLYIPLLAEFGGNFAVTAAEWLEKRTRNSMLDRILWTQYHVAIA